MELLQHRDNLLHGRPVPGIDGQALQRQRRGLLGPGEGVLPAQPGIQDAEDAPLARHEGLADLEIQLDQPYVKMMSISKDKDDLIIS
jgi:hypothetical protein